MKLAINKTFTNKAKPEDFKIANKNFVNVDISQDELAKHINDGFSFCSQHKNNYKKSSNFTCSGAIYVDIDEGLTLDDALNDNYINQYCSIVYTTVSHTKEFNRFRLIFELEETIEDAMVFKNCLAGISKKLGGDPSCTDACRMFYGSSGCEPIILGNTLPKEEAIKLIQLGEESNKPNNRIENTNENTSSTFRSATVVDQDTLVQTKDGSSHRLVDLPELTSIYCPIHVDKKASAFTIKSKQGVIGIHCSKCQTTYFTSANTPLYDFDYGLSVLDRLHNTDSVITEKDEVFGDTKHIKNYIFKYNQPYLPNKDVDAPIVFVKSPKGTGKTEWLKSIVEKAKKKNQSVLLIGHRRSLITSVSHRLGLISYINFSENNKAGNAVEKISYVKPTKHYAICADSLYKLLTPSENKYDVIVIDEVEQVFTHLTASTIKGIRNETYQIFKHYVDVVNNVYVMDADLNYLTVETIGDFLTDQKKHANVIINEPQRKKETIELYENKNQIIGDIIKSLDNNKRCFVCSNSKRLANHLFKMLEDKYGEGKNIICITSKNSATSVNQHFIRNIKTEILNYDATIVSPSVGTGVDITFPDNKANIDFVYGIFESRINTHLDIDQQISRVRHPGCVRVWISPETYRFETEQEVIKREALSIDRTSRRLLHYEADGTPVYDTNDGYLNLYANVKSIQRGSKNHLKQNFIKMKQYYGWETKTIEYDEETSSKGKEHIKIGKELELQERIDFIISSPIITEDDYVELDRKQERNLLDDNQIWSMRRYEIESFYYQEIDEEIIRKDNDAAYRYQIREYDLFYTDDSALIVQDKSPTNAQSHITDKKNYLLKKRFLQEAFKLSGLLNDNNELIPEKEFTTEDLGKFTDYVKKNNTRIQQWYEKPIRKDIDNKPVSTLNEFLKIIGIKTKRTFRKVGGVKKYYYRISQENIDELNEIRNRRNDSDLTEKWHLARNHISNERLTMEELVQQLNG
jgi:nucleoside-triphosphatase THEP1/uncharacterized CHY-type Zn-finger protein